MIVECPSCATRFNLDESRIGERGAKVRCSVCSHSFVVHPSSPLLDEVTEVDRRSVRAGAMDEGADTVPNASTLLPEPGEATQPDESTASFKPVGPQSIEATQLTVPSAPELLDGEDVIEIGAEEVDELSGFNVGESSHHHETVTEVGLQRMSVDEPADVAPYLDIEDSNSSGTQGGWNDAPMTFLPPDEQLEPTVKAAADPFSAASQFDAFPPEQRLAPPPTELDHAFGPPTGSTPLVFESSNSSSFESHSTAVFNVAQLAQSPDAIAGAPSLDADIPGGFGPSADDTGFNRNSGLQSTDSLYDQSAGRSRLRAVLSALVTAAMLFGLVAGSIYTLVYTGRLDPRSIGLQEVLQVPEVEPVGGYDRVYPKKVRSVLYSSRLGAELLVFVGEVENRGDSSRDRLDVVARLVDDRGRIVASTRAPVGVVFDVGDLAEVVDRRDVDALVASQLAAGLGGPIGPAEQRQFMVVLPSPPSDVATLAHQIHVSPRPIAQTPVVAPASQLERAGSGGANGGIVRKRKSRRGKRPSKVNYSADQSN